MSGINPESYLKYVKEVLGVKEVLCSDSILAEVSQKNSLKTGATDLVEIGEVVDIQSWGNPEGSILIVSLVNSLADSIKSKEIKALMEKMISAMKLDLSKIHFVESHSLESIIDGVGSNKPKIGVCFVMPNSDLDLGRELGKWIVDQKKNIKLMSTYHPGWLLKNANDKKMAWAHLQEVIKAV